jgi:hypothetical protein
MSLKFLILQDKFGPGPILKIYNFNFRFAQMVLSRTLMITFFSMFVNWAHYGFIKKDRCKI